MTTHDTHPWHPIPPKPARFRWTTEGCDPGVEVLVNAFGHVYASVKPYQGRDGRGGYVPHYTKAGGKWVRRRRVWTRRAAREDIYRRVWGKSAGCMYRVDEMECLPEVGNG